MLHKIMFCLFVPTGEYEMSFYDRVYVCKILTKLLYHIKRIFNKIRMCPRNWKGNHPEN